MEKEEFVNKGGIIGSEDAKIEQRELKKIKAIIRVHASEQDEAQQLATKVFAIKLRMEVSLEFDTIRTSIHPGFFIKELINAYQIKNVDFARYLGYNDNNLSAIYSGKRKVNFELAYKLSQIFEIKPEIWLFLQLKYDYQKFEQSNPDQKAYRLIDLIQSKAG